MVGGLKQVVLLAGLGLAVFGSAAQDTKPADWAPPKTTVAKELVEVGKFLLQHGMADPRGGKFAIAKVKQSAKWSLQNYTVDTIGWVKEINGEKVIVDMTGLDQPVDSVVREVPVAEAVKKALELSDASNNQIRGGFTDQLSNEDRLFSQLVTNESVMLLLIDGDIKEAESLFAKRIQIRSRTSGMKSVPAIDQGLPLEMLKLFLARKWGSAVSEHGRGYDERAGARCRILADNADAFRKYALNLAQAESSPESAQTRASAIGRSLDQVSVLLQDSLRRMKDGPKDLDLAKLDKLPQKARIEKLIDLLDEAKPPFEIDGMSVSFVDDPIVSRLIQEDAAAGDALLDCIQNDDRLTRATTQSHTFPSTYRFVPVKEAAFDAFIAIAKLDGNPLRWERAEDQAKLRTLWSELKTLTPDERWMKVLRDEAAKPEQWVFASSWFGRPKDEGVVRSALNRPKRDPKQPLPPPRSQELSASLRDELVELLLKRAKQIESGSLRDSSRRLYVYSFSLRLACDACRLNSKKAVPVLRELVAAALKEQGDRDSSRSSIQYELPRAFWCLIQAKEPSAVTDYLNWLRNANNRPLTDAMAYLPLSFLGPKSGDNAVSVLLADPQSSLYMDPKRFRKTPFDVAELSRTPLVYFPSFRSHLATLLTDKTRIGNVLVDAKTLTVAVVGDPGRWSMGGVTMSSTDLADAQKAVCRACDLYASQFVGKGRPEFQIYWSEKRKDEAIQKIIVYLNEHYQDIALEAQQFRVWQF